MADLLSLTTYFVEEILALLPLTEYVPELSVGVLFIYKRPKEYELLSVLTIGLNVSKL